MDPERLARLMEDAVGAVRPRTEALDLIRRGARRRRSVHRAAAVAAAFAVIVGGAIAYATVRGSAPPSGPATGVTSTRPPGARDWDVDGDGRPDSAHVVPLGKGGLNTKFLLVVQMTRLGIQKIPFTAAPSIKMPPGGPRVVGSVDADSDGRAEIFVIVDSGASTPAKAKPINRATSASAAPKRIRPAVRSLRSVEAGLRRVKASPATAGRAATVVVASAGRPE